MAQNLAALDPEYRLGSRRNVDTAAIVVDASCALWESDLRLALQRLLEVILSRGGIGAAAIVLEDWADDPIVVELTSEAGAGQAGLVSVPIVISHRQAGTLSATVRGGGRDDPAAVTDLLKTLSLLVAKAVPAHRARQFERQRLLAENHRLRRKVFDRQDLAHIVRQSAAMQMVADLLAKAALVDTPVLLLGEAGTGKEFLARALHQSSPWGQGPFCDVECRGLHESAVEAAFLGTPIVPSAAKHAHGIRPRSGGGGGVLFLEEVAALTPLAQSAALRVLESREFRRGTDTRAHTRVVATSSVELEHAVAQGRLRADLHHRLSGFTVEVPALRERAADISILAEQFLQRSASEHGKSIERLSPHALDLLARYPWPGNLRELSSVIENAVVLCTDAVIQAHHLPSAVRRCETGAPTAGFSLSESLDAYETHLLEDALKAAGGIRSRAARLLRTTERILNYKIRKHGIDCAGFRPYAPGRRFQGAALIETEGDSH